MQRQIKKICKVVDCEKVFYALGYCEMHYKRVKNNGTEKLISRNGKRSSNYKHGMHSTRIYKIWRGMFDRCGDKNNKYYYG